MINDNEVRKAVEVLRRLLQYGYWNESDYDKKALVAFDDLAEAYLKAGKDMPKLRTSMYDDGIDEDWYWQGWNRAVEDCRLAYTKREAELEKKLERLENVIWKADKQSTCNTRPCKECAEGIAKVVRKHLMGEA